MEHVLSATLELKDKFTSKIKVAGKELDKFTKKMHPIKSAVKETSESLRTGMSDLKNFAIAVGAFKLGSAVFSFIKDAYVGYAELEQVLTKNRAIMNASLEDSAKLKAQAMELGKTMPFTAKEVAEAQMYQAMAGMKTNEVLEMTPKLLKLSIASGQDLASTADILTDNLTAFGLELKDADRLMDVMAATANNTNTDIAGLGEAYKYVASTSRSFESMEEVNVLLGALANAGIKSGQAGRNLAGVYTRLAKATPDMDKALKKVGITLYDNNGKFKGLRKIIEEIRPKLARMTEEQRNYFLATIAGTEGLRVMATLLGTTEEGMNAVAKSIYESEGAINKYYDITKDTPENKIKALSSAFDNFKLTIAAAAAPAITGMVEDLTKKINELADSDTFSKENVESFFNAIKEGAKGAMDTLDALMLALKPIIWGLKTVGWVGSAGRNIGHGFFTPLSIKQTEEDTAIQEEYQRIAMMQSTNKEDDEKRKQRWIENKKREDNFYNSLDKGKSFTSGRMQTFLKERGRKVGEKVNLSDEEYEEMYYYIGGGNSIYKNKKPQEKIAQEKDKKSTTNGYKYIIKPPEKQKTELEKASDKLGLKAPVSPLSTTFSPEVNINMGGVVIKNEVDIEKTAEMSKQKIIAELKNYVQITK